MNHAGIHAIADIYLAAYPGDDAIMRECEAAITKSKMRVVSGTFKRFSPQGLTAVWILEESHFTVHTYPENNYISVDCYTCGDEGDPNAAIAYLADALGFLPGSKFETVARGLSAVSGDQGSATGCEVCVNVAT